MSLLEEWASDRKQNIRNPIINGLYAMFSTVLLLIIHTTDHERTTPHQLKARTQSQAGSQLPCQPQDPSPT
jgi:hypothetical protein